jgi:hypothetical protein
MLITFSNTPIRPFPADVFDRQTGQLIGRVLITKRGKGLRDLPVDFAQAWPLVRRPAGLGYFIMDTETSAEHDVDLPGGELPLLAPLPRRASSFPARVADAELVNIVSVEVDQYGRKVYVSAEGDRYLTEHQLGGQKMLLHEE